MLSRRTVLASTLAMVALLAATAPSVLAQSGFLSRVPSTDSMQFFRRGLAGARTAADSTGESAEGGQEEGIRDNSFLVEEAYNQEPGVVQHVFNFVPAWDAVGGLRTRTFDFVFTQEWPVFGQRHQFSYTLPLHWMRETYQGDAFEGQGFGDMLLNYRLQVWNGDDRQPAFAPRFSVILPTGDERDGLGNGKVGYQINLPMSWEFERWIFHANGGLTVVPGVSVGVDPEILFPGRTLNGYNLGCSAICKIRPFFDLMLETVALWDEELDWSGREDHLFEFLLSPGFRWAPYTEGSTQWVLGAAVPVGLSRDAPDISAFLYMSFEHRFWRERE